MLLMLICVIFGINYDFLASVFNVTLEFISFILRGSNILFVVIDVLFYIR